MELRAYPYHNVCVFVRLTEVVYMWVIIMVYCILKPYGQGIIVCRPRFFRTSSSICLYEHIYYASHMCVCSLTTKLLGFSILYNMSTAEVI